MMPKYLKRGEVSEHTIQKMVVEYLKLRGFGNFIIKIHNEGAGIARRGKQACEAGLRIGASDLFIAIPRHSKHGMWLELKSEHGTLKPAQLKFLADMERHNYHTFAAWSFDEAKVMLDWYLFEK